MPTPFLSQPTYRIPELAPLLLTPLESYVRVTFAPIK